MFEYRKNGKQLSFFFFCSERICLKAKYLFTSYVSTKAMKPSGNAMAYETMAANSPSEDSSVDTSNTDARDCRCLTACSSKSPITPFRLKVKVINRFFI